MASEMAEAIRQLIQERGISEDLVKKTIEDSLIAAYKRTYGTSENAVVRFEDDLSDVSIYSKKIIVDGVYDPVMEIELEDALKLDPSCEIGDEFLVLEDPHSFNRSSIQTGKQTAHQSLRDFQKDSLYAEYKDKIGQVVIGYYQREHNGNIYVDLGKLGKVEGFLPKKFQSAREVYEKNDRIKALITDIKKTGSGLQIILSRTDTEFVRSILDNEVPEIRDKTVEIFKIVREPSYRTKVAVFTNREDVDPVGACVGLKGVRIQAVISELEGEKIDILKYDPDPRVFIKNALSPAEVLDVIILDESKRQALAIVADSQFSLAIGKQGLNVRLANRLVDWSIDVKTEDQCDEIEALTAESRKAVDSLFSDGGEENEINTIADLRGVDIRVAELLKAAGIETIVDYLAALDEGKVAGIDGISEEDIQKLQDLIESEVEIVEDGASSAEGSGAGDDSEEEYYECPECGARITIDMKNCPNCGVGLSFEFEDEE